MTGRQHPAIHDAARRAAAPRPVRHRRTHAFQLALLVAVAAFGVLAFFARQTAYFTLDLQITQALQALNSPAFAALMALVSWFGYSPQSLILVVLIGLLLLGLGLRREALASFVAAIGIGVLNTGVKVLVHRPRPTADLVHVVRTLDSYGFPSGHVMFYTAYFGFLFFLAFTRLRSSLLRSLLLAALGGLVLLVGVSRIYLGEHWASDVLAAYLLGGLGLTAAISLYRRMKPLEAAEPKI